MFLLGEFFAHLYIDLLKKLYGDDEDAMMITAIVIVSFLLIIMVLMIINFIKEKDKGVYPPKEHFNDEKENTKNIDWIIDNGYRGIKEKITDFKRKRKQWKDGI